MKSYQGQLLVASPHLPDPNFRRTVVLLLKHNEQGAFGVVLNRPSSNTIQDFWQMVSDQPCESDQVINVGGPLHGPLMAIHTQESWSEDEIFQGVYFATHKDNLGNILTQSEQPFRIFSGYAGWGEGQLENELTAGGWLLTPATFQYLFQLEPPDAWQKIIKDIGDAIILPALKIKHPPSDPSLN